MGGPYYFRHLGFNNALNFCAFREDKERKKEREKKEKDDKVIKVTSVLLRERARDIFFAISVDNIS